VRGRTRICRQWSADTERAGHLPGAIRKPLQRWLEQAPQSLEKHTPLAIGHPHRPGSRLRVEISQAPGNSFGRAQHLLILAPDGEAHELLDGTSRALPLLKCLSPSERNVAGLVASGLRNDASAERLCRSRKTIECQISSIFRKLNIANRTQLARLLN